MDICIWIDKTDWNISLVRFFIEIENKAKKGEKIKMWLITNTLSQPYQIRLFMMVRQIYFKYIIDSQIKIT